MKSELRIGRLRGSGAVINLTTANQVVGGLSVTLDVPKGCQALVTLTGVLAPNNNLVALWLEVDGVLLGPPIYQQSAGNVNVTGAQTYTVGPGRRALRVLANGTTAAGSMDPAQTTLSWVIAPLGGIAN